jgi:alpha-amylase
MKSKLLFTFMLFLSLGLWSQVNNPRNQVVLQGFWWNYWNSNYPNGWANYLAELAPRLKELGIDAVWIPPTIKNTGANSVGYAPFDHYDLGDKFQKNSLKTRMGDKDELLRMVAVMKANGLDVIQDVVLNHTTGAGTSSGLGGQDQTAMDDGETGKYKTFRYSCFATPAVNETAANYLSRAGRFPKNWQNFYPNNNNACCTNPINSPYWGPDISYESNAYGTSGNATYNPPQTSDYMRNEMRNWLIWYKKQVGWDGVRLDAVKHFPTYVSEDYLWNLQYGSMWANGGNDMYAVGEWVGGSSDLDGWCNAVQNRAGTFDFGFRGGVYSAVASGGNFDLGSIPGYQQQNRSRTAPFINLHDTFRPNLDANGNYIGWDSANELAAHIEPNDPRSSMAYAITMAVDGAPQVFFEDLFNIGYNGNRFDHTPSVALELPVRSDLENILWCHQNLHFKEGQYLVRWQAADALVIERQGKAIIAVNDQYSNWQYLNGVQTSWPDGTVLRDYSGANTGTFVVYGGGKMNIAIPPCDGTAVQGRRGYCIWAPEGITTNYDRGSKRITQEWEMADDLGDKLVPSLQQGGSLPNNSLDCRVVGRIFPNAGDSLVVQLFPQDTTLALTLVLVDNNCQPIDSISGKGFLKLTYTPDVSSWHTVKVRNATNQQSGQKCWVQVNYRAPEVVQTNLVKNKCECQISNGLETDEILMDQNAFKVAPNPFSEEFHLTLNTFSKQLNVNLYGSDGRRVLSKSFQSCQEAVLSAKDLESGVYMLEVVYDGSTALQRLVKY